MSLTSYFASSIGGMSEENPVIIESGFYSALVDTSLQRVTKDIVASAAIIDPPHFLL